MSDRRKTTSKQLLLCRVLCAELIRALCRRPWFCPGYSLISARKQCLGSAITSVNDQYKNHSTIITECCQSLQFHLYFFTSCLAFCYVFPFPLGFFPFPTTPNFSAAVTPTRGPARSQFSPFSGLNWSPPRSSGPEVRPWPPTDLRRDLPLLVQLCLGAKRFNSYSKFIYSK